MDFCDWLKALNYAQVIADAKATTIKSIGCSVTCFADCTRIDTSDLQRIAETYLKGGEDDL